jgi:YebC/PmpR family DNA-binding regulatory protein
MAGHSKWANIKHKKAATDAKRSKVWSKMSKAIIVAAKGGPDPSANARLRTAIADAKSVGMPKDNIERAIKRATGDVGGEDLVEVLYEGYGPAGVAILCDILTDNRNRTAPEIRKVFEKFGGQLGTTGCVSYLFDRKGLLAIPTSVTTEDSLMELLLDVGVDDISTSGEVFEVLCDPANYANVCDTLESNGIECQSKQVARIPQTTIDLNAEQARQVLALVEALDDHDDVQSVSSNSNVSEEVMAELES